MRSPEQTVWWHVYPLGFTGAPIRDRTDDGVIVPRLPHLTAWLEYAVELGATGLALGPVFAAETHGYDTVDHFRIDPRLGDDADFDALVAAAHTRGLRVMLDGVFNHVGRAHPAFQDAVRDSGHPHAAWFHLDPASGAARTFEGHDSLVLLNHENPHVQDHVGAVLRHWLARGVDAWRLDAAYAIPASFWTHVLPGVRAEYPDAWFVGEMIHGDYAAYVAESGLDAVTQYELWKALWSSLADQNLYELAWALDRHNGFVEKFVPLTFVGNHDVTRIASQVGDRLAGVALTVLATVGGVISVYYGDEQAFRGEKGEGFSTDDDLRPTLPDTPVGLAPEGEWMHALYRRLIGMRRRHPWLTRARVEVTDKQNEHISYTVTDGEHRCEVTVTLQPEVTAQIRFDDGEDATFTW